MQEADLKIGKLLFLSQHHSSNGRKAITATLGNKPIKIKIGYIASQPDDERIFFEQTRHFYQQLGYELSTFLELEEGFDEVALNQLLKLDAIHLSGGDTFRFLSAIKNRGLESLLTSYYQKGGILIGVSAGAMIMTPSIETAMLCGDVNTVGLIDQTGLSLVDFNVIPHVEDKFSLIEQGVTPKNCYLMSDEDALLYTNCKFYKFGAPIYVKAKQTR